MPTNLSPKSQLSAIILTSTGSVADVASSIPFGIYTGSIEFLSGAADQVAYTFKKLGGDVVDIEITPSNVYAAYEEAVLEYSYIVNLHQSKNSISNALGNLTGTFDHNGKRMSGPVSASVKYPRFQVQQAKRIGDSMSTIAGFGGTVPQFSASFKATSGQQDYDLQQILETQSTAGVDDSGNAVPFAGKVGNKRVIVDKVYFKTPRAMWRFFGYYGGINVIGNYSTYGQFADDSTFEIVPTWQNKMQAIMYEDSIYTRTSHYSYEVIDNKLRLYPRPGDFGFENTRTVWFRFYLDDNNVFESNAGYEDGVNGVNNINTLPFGNIPYENINSIGKQWIRKYALALCKEMLGQIRGKFTTIPIPGESVTLNHSELLSQAKDEQQQLKDKLMEMLKEVEYKELVKYDAETTDATEKIFKASPLPIFVG
tara:strand:+ start:35 stop:1309 length:1275 start_codon:yes stop_codon:yes gene_type:complete